MKTLRSFLLALGVLFTSFGVDAQTAKKPIIMIVPSDNWCTQRYFTQTFKDQGRTVRVSDYGLAFQEDTELGGVISKVGEILTGLGYELKDCEQELKNISMRSGEDNATISKVETTSKGGYNSSSWMAGSSRKRGELHFVYSGSI